MDSIHRRALIAILLSILWTGLTLLAHFFEILEPFEIHWADWEPAALHPTPSTHLALIAIDRIPGDRPWPWPRLEYAMVLRGMISCLPESAVFEVLLHDRDQRQQAFDSAFSGIVERFGRVTFAAAALQAGNSESIPANLTSIRCSGSLNALPPHHSVFWPIETFASGARIGISNLPGEKSKILRKIPLLFRWHQTILPSLSLQAAGFRLDADWKKSEAVLGTAIFLRNSKGDLLRSIPIDASGQLLLRYRGNSSPLTIPFDDFILYSNQLAQGRDPDRNVRQLHLRQVWIGRTDDPGTLHRTTPTGTMSPVLIHMTAADNILSNDFCKPVPFWVVVFLFLTFACGGSGLLVSWDRKQATVTLFLLMLFYVEAALLAFKSANLILPGTPFLLSAAGTLISGLAAWRWELGVFEKK